MSDQKTLTHNTLARYAKAIAAVVEAGCKRPPWWVSPYGEIRNNAKENDQFCVCCGTTQQAPACNSEAAIAAYEKWVREDVVVWAEQFGFHIEMPTWKPDAERWHWCVGSPFTEGAKTGTEAHIAFLEAIAEAVAGEKGGSDG